MASGLFLLGVIGLTAAAQMSAPSKEPPRIYVDKGACPFECCTYREWVALKNADLVETPNGKKVVGSIKKGEKVLALTGEVRSRPVKAVTHDGYPEVGVKAGEIVYVIDYVGEGYWKIWHDGKIDQIQDLPGGVSPKTRWWVKLKTATGVVGWIEERRNFDNVGRMFLMIAPPSPRKV